MVHPKFSFGVNIDIIRNNETFVLFSYRSFYTRVKNVNLAPFDRSYRMTETGDFYR